MSKSNYLENKLLDHLTGVAAYASPTLYVGVSSTAPNEDGTNITEPSGGGYARVTTAGKWAASSGGSAANNADVTFPISSGAWLGGTALPYFVVFDALTGGNMLRYGSLTPARSVPDAGVTLYFPVGSLVMTED